MNPMIIKQTKEARTHLDVKASDISVECLPNGMQVSIPKCKLRGLRSLNDIHLIDNLCHASDNGTHLVAFTPILQRRECMTKKSYNPDGILYTNILTTRRPSVVQAMGLCPLLKLKFSCMYPYFSLPLSRSVRSVEKILECEHLIGVGPAIEQGVFAAARVRTRSFKQKGRMLTCPLVIGVGPSIRNGIFGKDKATSRQGFKTRAQKYVCKPLNCSGTFNIEMRAYSDEEYKEAIGKMLVTDREYVNIFYEIKLDTPDEHLVIAPTKCYATPTANPKDEIQYVFISESCAKDTTVRFYSAPQKSARFSIQSFKFSRHPSSSFYVHCDIAICDVNDTESQCAQGCAANTVGRSRRHFSDEMYTKVKISQLPGIEKTCQMDNIKLSIRKSFLPDIQAKNLHLNKKNCIAGENETHFLFNFNARQCGTIRLDGTYRVGFRNMIYLKLKGATPFGNDISFASPVICYFTKEQVKSQSFTYRLSKPKRFFAIAKSGDYKVQFKILADASVAKRYTKSPLDVGLREYKGILGVMVAAMDNNTVFNTKHCALKPSLISIRKEVLIGKGCPVHKSVLYYSSDGRREFMRIDFRDWHSPSNLMHLTCSVIVCDKRNPSEECKKLCKKSPSHRRRRSAGLDINTSISCGPKSMTISIEKTSAPGLKQSDVHLQDTKCTAVDNTTHLLLTTPLEKCGTKVYSNGKRIEYSNIVLQKMTSEITRSDFLELPVKCTYPIINKVQSKGIKAKKSLIQFSGTSTGSYKVRINLFDDDTFSKRRATSLATISQRDDLYFEVGIDKTDLNVALYLEKCFGRPAFATSEREEYVFIEKNCAVDGTVRFYDSGRIDRRRFSLKPFQFSDIKQSILINCVVSACDPNDAKAPCFKKCPAKLF